MSLQVYFSIIYFQTFLSAFIAMVCWVFPREKSVVIKLIGLLFFISFLGNASSIILREVKLTQYMNFGGSMYDLAYVSIVLTIYNIVFEKKHKSILRVVGVIFIIGALCNLLFFQKLGITSYTKFAGSFIIVPLLVYFFYKLLVDLPTVHLQRLPMFWISSAFLIYSSGALFLYAFTDYLVNVLDDDLIMYWSFHNLLFIIQDAFILVGLSVKRVTSKTSFGERLQGQK